MANIKEVDSNQFRNTKEKKVPFLFCTMFFFPIINGFINEIIQVMGILSVTSYIYILIYLLAAYIYFQSVFIYYKKTIVVFLSILFIFITHLLVYDGVYKGVFNFSNGITGIATSHFFLLFMLGLPLLFISMCMGYSSLKYLSFYLEKYSYIVMVLFLITVFTIFKSSARINYMTIAYNAMPSLLIMMYCGIKEKKIVAFVLFILGSISIFIIGCRGAILQLFVTIVLFLFLDDSKKTAKKFALIVVLAIFGIIIFVHFNKIINWLSILLDNMGISSRSIRMLLGNSADGDVMHFDDRALLYDNTIPALSVLGSGIFVYPENVGYPHNIVLEILLGFGYLVGSIILILLVRVIRRSYAFCKSISYKFVKLLWISSTTTILVKMMLSASYLTDRVFWFYLSLMLYIIRIGKENKNVESICQKSN